MLAAVYSLAGGGFVRERFDAESATGLTGSWVTHFLR
jgi:hypothetical protein